MLVFLQSCKNDKLSDVEPMSQISSGGDTAYDAFGAKLESAIDKALKDESFKMALIKLTQERRMGDFDVLMTSFLERKTKKGIAAKEILLEYAEGAFNESELDAFLENYPSLLIATRGNIYSWVMNEHNPPTVFVPGEFKETSEEIIGTKDGQRTNIKLDKRRFEDVVIVMHISERHDAQGNPIIKDHTASLTNGASTNRPGVNLSEEGGAGLRSSCDPEPVFCTPPTVESFEVQNINGGVQLDYEISNFPTSLCTWG